MLSLRSLGRWSVPLTLGAWLAACSGGYGPVLPPVHETVPLTQLLHPGTPIVAFVDMSSVAQSPYFQPLRDALGVLPADARGPIERTLSVLDETHSFVWGYEPDAAHAAQTNLIALRGTYRQASLEALGELPETETYREHTLRGRGQEWVSVVTFDTLLLASPLALHDAIDRYDGIFPRSGPTRPGYAEAAASAGLGARDISVVVIFTESLRARLGAGHIEGVLRENGVSAGLSVQARQGLQLEGFVTTNDPRAVPLLAHGLRAALTELQSDMGVTALGASGLLEQVQITEDGATLRVRLQVSDEEARPLVDNVGSLLRTLFARQ